MIAIVDYGAGNVASVANALEILHTEYKISNNETFICNADKIIFPGVGEASYAVRQLHMYNLFSALRMVKKPMLGICLGMQLMCSHLTEGNVAGLGIFPGQVEKFDPSKTKVPHMGWNSIDIRIDSRLFAKLNKNETFYYAHSYYLPVDNYSTAVTENGILFAASIKKGNYYGVQFHPEKSGDAGLTLLKNFIDL